MLPPQTSTSSVTSILLGVLITLLFFFLITAQHNTTSLDYEPTIINTDNVNDTSSSSSSTSSLSVSDEFIASNEWQEVRPDQSIPPGLWVRMDMTTGKKTARLLPKEGEEGAETDTLHSTAQSGLIVINKQEEHQDVEDNDDEEEEIPVVPHPSLSSERVGTLGSVPALEPAPDGFSPPSPAEQAALKAIRAQRLRELSEYFRPTDDLVVIKQLISLIMSPESTVEIVAEALELLETLCHQVDNAMDWVHLQGIDIVMQLLDPPALGLDAALPASLLKTQQQVQEESLHGEEAVQQRENASSSYSVPVTLDPSATAAPTVSPRVQRYRLASLQERAAWLLGTAAQNNAHVQREAKKEGAIYALLTVLDRSGQQLDAEHQLTSDNDSENGALVEVSTAEMVEALLKVNTKSLYALSSILRSSADSQEEFHRRGGTQRLMDIIHQYDTQKTDKSSSDTEKRLQSTIYYKTLGLLSDLLHDRLVNTAETNATTSSINTTENNSSRTTQNAASSAALFEQLTDETWCSVYSHLTSVKGAQQHLLYAADPATSLSASLLSLRIVDTVYNLLLALAEHRLCIEQLSSQSHLDDHHSMLQQIYQREQQQQHAVAADQEHDESRDHAFRILQRKIHSLRHMLNAIAAENVHYNTQYT